MITYLLVHEGKIEVAQHETLSLAELQRLVGGWIEGALQLPAEDGGTLMLYCNDEGKMQNLPWNFYLNSLQDMIVGPLVIAAVNEEGETRSLTPSEVALFTMDRINNLSLLRYGAHIL